MKNMSVTRKLWISVWSLVAGMLVVAGIAGYSTGRFEQAQQEAEATLTKRLEQAHQWSAMTQANAVRTMAVVLSTEATLEKEFAPQISATSQKISAVQKALENDGLSAESQAQMARIQQLRSEMMQVRQQALKLKQDGQTAASQDLVSQRYKPAVDRYLGGLQGFVELQGREMQALQTDMAASRAQLNWMLGAAVLVLVAAVVLGAGWLIQSIRKPLAQANAIAERIAAGDLSQHVGVDRSDEFGQLLLSLRNMHQALGGMIQQVRQSTDSIALASSEIASGNHDLSQRTEQTSSRLQQAATAMAQLTGTLQQTAGSAQQAAQMAEQASGVAQRGGTVVGQVVSTMNDIHASSQKIADIIGVIDSIAFQTNILALNAAVEAARAGDQGRGFAVVASEVRSLAGRSAEAAKQIKQLIQDSVERVADGAKLVEQAGGTMQEIVQSIERVTHTMAEINAVAAEQRDGIAQVSEAVSSLDQMTQQNAALVEQSAAAAQSLSEQSQQMKEVVERFKVPAGQLADSGSWSRAAHAAATPRSAVAMARSGAHGAEASAATSTAALEWEAM